MTNYVRKTIHWLLIIHLRFIGKRIQITAKTHIRQRQTKKRFLDAGFRVFEGSVLVRKRFITIQVHFKNQFLRVRKNYFQAVVFGDLGLDLVGFDNQFFGKRQ